MTETIEFAFTGDGLLHRRVINDTVVRMPDGAMERLSAKVPKVARGVFAIQGQTVHLAFTPEGYTFATLSLIGLSLRCRYNVVDGIVVLAMTGNVEPVVFHWVPPGSMGPKLLVSIRPPDPAYRADKLWLFAVDDRGNTWRLPLGNLYDDCGVCSGRDTYRGSTIQDVVEKALYQMEKSEWNGDLWKDVEATQRLFRFRAVKDGFAQENSEENWTRCCRKVGTAAATHLIL